jgi:hypothetical protein
MAFLEDPLWGRIAIPLLLGVVATTIYFSVEHLLVLTRRNFGNVNVNLVVFTRRDINSTSNAVEFESLGGNMPLMGLLRNRYLFWIVVWATQMTNPDERVLDMGKRGYDVLWRIRGYLTERFASMTLKRFAGLPFVRIPCQMCLVYRHSENPEDKRTRILWVLIIPQEELDNFMYFKDPPRNTENWELVEEVYISYWAGSGSFLPIRITSA